MGRPPKIKAIKKTAKDDTQLAATPVLEPVQIAPIDPTLTAPTVSATPVPVTSPGPLISEADGKKLVELLTNAQLEYNNVQTKILKEKKKEISSLNYQIKEYLGAFLLIGYDLNNNPIEMISAGNATEYDALLERLRRLMFKINQNIVSSNGQDPYGLRSE